MTTLNPSKDSFVYTFQNNLSREQVPSFHELQKKMDAAAKHFDGYLGRELVMESHDSGIHCTIRIHFQRLEQCLAWLDSKERRQLLNEAEASMGYSYKSGLERQSFEQWLSARIRRKPPTWKVNLLVWLALYPTVMLLSIAGQSSLDKLPFALRILISNAITIAITGWLLVPWLSRVYQPWLEHRSPRWQRLGTLSILGLLLCWLAVFSLLPPRP
jgi:antibiotic biosynthesis monooxygenase (ABM) superfamily enzyme